MSEEKKIKYLYGAAVQGIQSFIFQTNELKDIVGASELVEQICTTTFDRYATEGISILRAAGNIKHVFNTQEACEKAVRDFPKLIMTKAPGITISQAVVKYTDDSEKAFGEAVDKLELLLHAQRNKPPRSLTLGLTGILRSRTTGLPVVKKEIVNKQVEFWDAPTLAKRNKIYQNSSKLCENFFGTAFLKDKMEKRLDKFVSQNDWIAIIHADGNGLGKVVQKVGKKAEEFKNFSEKLDKATRTAAQNAYKEVNKIFNLEKEEVIPIRPIVLGGDDLTIICRADIALQFTQAFLAQFEEETSKELRDILTTNNVFSNQANKLTACAGIAYIKSSYPFYYGYNLAEELCSEAKKHVKNNMKSKGDDILIPSCLMFHKVQSSFVESYSIIEERELTADKGISFKFGPYYINETDAQTDSRWTTSLLLKNIEILNTEEGKAIKSHFREWINLLITNPGYAEQKFKRLKSIIDLYPVSENVIKLKSLTNEIEKLFRNKCIPVFDMLSVHSAQYQVTKPKNG